MYVLSIRFRVLSRFGLGTKLCGLRCAITVYYNFLSLPSSSARNKRACTLPGNETGFSEKTFAHFSKAIGETLHWESLDSFPKMSLSVFLFMHIYVLYINILYTRGRKLDDRIGNVRWFSWRYKVKSKVKEMYWYCYAKSC